MIEPYWKDELPKESVTIKKCIAQRCPNCGTGAKLDAHACLLCSYGFPTQEQMEKLARKLLNPFNKEIL